MDAVDLAFAAAPRERFLPSRLRRRADFDGPLPLGHGSTCSQPRTVADMLRLLLVLPGSRVLDVGAGSGWTTALLAELTGPTGSVLGVELEPAVAASGAANVRRHSRPWARLEASEPGILGAPAHAPYDRILVSADAASIPAELVDQLAEAGRMVVPVHGAMTAVQLGFGRELLVSRHGRYRFVPLR